MLCQAVSTGYVALTAKEGRSSAVGLYVTTFYVGGSIGAFLPGLAYEAAGWGACVAMIVAMQVDHGRDRRPRLGAIDDVDLARHPRGNAHAVRRASSNSCGRSIRRPCAT